MATDSRAGLQFVLILGWVNMFVIPVLGAVVVVFGIVALTRGNSAAWLIVVLGALCPLAIPLGIARRRQAREHLRMLDGEQNES